jgi:subtilase family serine protease
MPEYSGPPGLPGPLRRSPSRPRPDTARPRPGGCGSGGPGRPGRPGRLARGTLLGLLSAATVAALVAGGTLGATAATAAPASAAGLGADLNSGAGSGADSASGTGTGNGSAVGAVGASADGMVALAGVQPSWAQPQDATGTPAASAPVTTRVFLAGPDPQGLAATATAVSTPGSGSYRDFLSASSAAARYAPSTATQDAVASWLRSSGLTVTAVNSQYVEAAGTTSAVDRTYGVTLRTYAGAGAGTGGDAGADTGAAGDAAGDSAAIAPDRNPSVPARLAADVATVSGLSTRSQPMYAQHVTAATASQDLRRLRGGGGSAPTGPLIPSPCSSYYGQVTDTTDPAYDGVHEPYAVCGYSAEQLRSAYGATGHSGRGTTVAILDAYNSPTMLSDADTWSAHNGLPGFGSGQYVTHATPADWNNESSCGGTAGWAAEQSLDVEAVHAMAPGARVLYYGANSCQDSDLLAALSDLITHHLASVISDSWGGVLHSSSGDESASTVAEYEHLFQLAAVEGISVNFSAGDCGDNDPSTGCGNSESSTAAQTTFPASDPWVTAVGGTSAAIDTHGRLDWSTSWGTDASVVNQAGNGWTSLGWVFGGGGGTSADFAQPRYQAREVPSSLADTLLTGAAASGARRVVPDLALDADPFTGLLVGATQKLPNGSTGYAEAAIGGTSLASPLLSGLEADSVAERGGVPLGFVNPTLYCMGHDRYALRDVTDTPAGVQQPIGEVFPPFDGQSAALAGLGEDGALHAGTGYDDATGLGTPGPGFIEELASW